jgi:ribonuclease HI
MSIIIYTDGSCRNKGDKKGGWGAVLLHMENEKRLYGTVENTTSNRMELMAPLEALKALKRHDLPVKIFSDSQYLIKGITEWSKNWIKNGWKNSNGDAVTNKDLWLKLLKWDKKLIIQWNWVRGHAGDTYQEVAHTLADNGLRQ